MGVRYFKRAFRQGCDILRDRFAVEYPMTEIAEHDRVRSAGREHFFKLFDDLVRYGAIVHLVEFEQFITLGNERHFLRGGARRINNEIRLDAGFFGLSHHKIF